MATSSPAPKRSRKNRDTLWFGPGGPWHADAPRTVRRNYRDLGDERAWRAWQKQLAKRPLTAPLALALGRQRPLAWGWTDKKQIAAPLWRLVKRLDPRKVAAGRKLPAIREAAASWLNRPDTVLDSAEFGIQCLAWAGALGELAAHLSERLWWSLLNRLVAIAGQGPGRLVDAVAAQLLAVELPLTLAYQFPELVECRRLADVGRSKLNTDIAEMLDGEGLLHGRYLAQLGPLLACWTRCRLLGTSTVGDVIDAQYAGLVQHALRLCRRDGRPFFAPRDAGRLDRGLLATAISLAADRPTAQLAKLLNGKQSAKRARATALEPSFQGEWAGVAVLRPDWKRKAPQLAVTFDGPQVKTELTTGKGSLWSGAWTLELTSGGEALPHLGHWAQVCWESDGDIDYLELELELAREVTVQRHMLLARKDRFLLLGDAILNIQSTPIEYRGTLPIAAGVSFVEESETREGRLQSADANLARVLPLDLPEWRCARNPGHFRATPQGLELRQAAAEGSLFAGLWVDLDPKRVGKPLTWRQLTVAAQRRIVPRDVAVGYRVQIGKAQWLIYRSLGPPAIRTVLGKNLMHEFLVGRFGTDGLIDTLLEIEG